jgi:hypothetical protein
MPSAPIAVHNERLPVLAHAIQRRESLFPSCSKMSNFPLNFEYQNMAKNTDRLQVMLSLRTHAFLARLGAKGTHGTDSTDAAKTLIEQGIRRAIREGFLDKDDVRIAHAADRTK